MVSSNLTLEEKIRALPHDLRREVEDFVEFLLQKQQTDSRPSALDILDEPPGEGVFRTADEVRAYLDEERASWER